MTIAVGILDKWAATDPAAVWPSNSQAPTECAATVPYKQRTKRRHRGQHKDLAREDARSSQLFVGNNVWSSIHRNLTTLSTLAYTWEKEALGAYRGYKKLLGERKFAREFPVQTVSFTDLPPEIRNRILEDVLVVGPIEFAAKSGRMGRTNQVRSGHHRSYIRNIKSNLGVLRLNKQINAEASQIFYGMNEFRFTGLCGHDMLTAFCNTIGKHNTLCLTNITEHVPWSGKSGDLHDRPAQISKTSWENFNEMLERRGYHQRGRWSGKSTVARTLTRADSLLLQYRIVLPEGFDLSNANCEGGPREEDLKRCFDYHDTGSLLPQLESQGDSSKVTITLVILGHEEVAPGIPHYVVRGKQAVLRRRAMEYAWAKGWNVEEAFMSDKGYYTYNKVEQSKLAELDPQDVALFVNATTW